MNKQELIDIIKQMSITATDKTALKGLELYPIWNSTTHYNIGDRIRFICSDGIVRLFKCIQAHDSQIAWTPEVTPSLWNIIDIEHEGTLDDPIPAVTNMEYIKGKYYIENNIVYLMNREGMADGESVTLAYTPSQLVGHYFEIV